MLLQADNWLVWTILLTATFSYTLLFDCALKQRDGDHSQQDRLQLIATSLATLPLLGLLGTIIGLLDTFSSMASQTNDIDLLMAGGVGMALGSTQLGLLFCTPGLLMHQYLYRLQNKYLALNLESGIR